MPKKARSPRTKKKNAARKPARRSAALAAALAEAGWADADTALAEALMEFDALREAQGRVARAEAAELLGQALTRAARRRGFARVGKPGALEAFDARRHVLAEPLRRAPKTVRIIVSGVSRGPEVLAKARVGGARARRR
jgi:hypothetical protein